MVVLGHTQTIHQEIPIHVLVRDVLPARIRFGIAFHQIGIYNKLALVRHRVLRLVPGKTNVRRRRMKAVVWSKPACPYCEKAKNLLKNKGIEYEEKNIADGHKIQDLLELVPNARTMPQIWLDKEHIGGFFELEKKLNETT